MISLPLVKRHHALALVLALGLLSCTDDEPVPLSMNPGMIDPNNVVDAPAFRLESVNGGKVSLGDFKGKPLVIFLFGIKMEK